MRKELLSEINRFREIVGLKLINESMNASTPVQEGLEKILERFGVSGTRALDAAALESMERSIASDTSVLNKLEVIGNEISQGTAASVDRLVDSLAKDLIATRLIFSSLSTEAPVVFQELADGIVMATSKSTYKDFEVLWASTKDHQEIVNAARRGGFITDENEIFWEKWEGKGGNTPIPPKPVTGTLNRQAELLFDLQSSANIILDKEAIDIMNSVAAKFETEGMAALQNMTKIELLEVQKGLRKMSKELQETMDRAIKTTNFTNAAEKQAYIDAKKSIDGAVDELDKGANKFKPKKILGLLFKIFIFGAGLTILGMGHDMFCVMSDVVDDKAIFCHPINKFKEWRDKKKNKVEPNPVDPPVNGSKKCADGSTPTSVDFEDGVMKGYCNGKWETLN